KGWRNVLGLCVLPLILVLLIFAYCAKEAPDRPVPKAVREYAAVLRDGDAWSFMFFYGITFGGFVGLASSLTLYFHDQYGMPAVTAGSWTAVCVLAGSFMRPVGGFVADRVGGIYVLSVLYIVTATTLGMLSLGMPDVWMAIAALIVSLAALGMGNGAIFQLLPQRFRSEFGMMTGLVGMAGGLGGFILASGLGYSKQLTNSYQTGFLGFALLALVALLGLTRIKGRWRTTWGTAVLGSVRI
ncbi:MAG: MFS transporter, partial [Rhodospirillaceae bacterium]